ncbi:unnamed protein product, partial [Meganyctiphanes norvegica]
MSTLEADSDRGQWELSKENFQPLKQGRKATVLSVALDENAQKKLALERQEFEKELRTYSGDDPLDIWYRYVVWVEQNYPKGGKDGNIKVLIEKCVEAIQSSQQYLNDPRYLEIWIKYASISSVSLEIYQALDSKGIGSGLAAYYESYAWELEKVGNYKRADALYQLGIDRLAKPIDQLEASHKKFQARVSRSAVEGSVDQLTNSTEPQRGVFTALKTQGAKNRVANERVGSNVIGGAGRVNIAKQSTNTMGPTFQIFSDENTGSGISRTSGSTGVGSVPGRSNMNKENDRNPSQWTKAKASQKTTSIVNVEDVDKVQKPAFSVHTDGNSAPNETPSKLCPNSNVLATRKDKYDDWQVPRFIAEPFDPTKQAQYPKNKVYCGTEEFSLEELRAANYFKKVEEAKKREEEEKKREEEEKKKRSEMEAMQAALQQQAEMMKRQEEMIQQLLQAQQLQQQQQQQQHQKSTLYQDSFVQINKSVNFTVNQSHLLDESTTRGLLQMQPATGGISSKESSLSLEPINSGTGSGPNSRDVSLLSFSRPPTNKNCKPTPNTKFARDMINDMWNASLFNNTHTNSAKDSDSCDPVVAPVTSAPFAVFCDENNKKESPQKMSVPEVAPFEIFSDENTMPKPEELPAALSFAIHSDEPKVSSLEPKADQNELYAEENQENQAPAGFSQLKEKRQLSGILLPAVNVEFCPLDEQKDDDKEAEEKEAVKKDSGTPEPKDDDMDGVNPLEDDISNFTINGGAMADFTLKMPTRPEDFINMAKMASTPGPWSLGLVPQGFKDGDDYTMAIDKIKKRTFDDDDDECMTEDKSAEKEDKSGELMPPPPLTVPTPKTPTNGANCGSSSPLTLASTIAKSLSPIMEASREYRSSSGSSPGSSTTLGSHSTTHGLTQQGQTLSTTTMTKSRQLSCTLQQEGELPMDIGGINNYDVSKSGYLADKSRGESLAESKRFNKLPRMSLMPVASSDFDPDAAAAMLCDMDEDMGLGNIGEISIMSPPAPLSAPPSTKNRAKINFKGPINPFSDSLLEQLLDNLDEPVEKRGGYCPADGKLPIMKTGMQMRLGDEIFQLKRTCGEGAYATVFHASTIDPMNVTLVTSFDDDEEDVKQMILKVQKPAFPWEFYICHELRQRLKAQSQPKIMLDAIMRINRGYFYSNGSILVNDYHKYGTLLNVINKYKVSGVPLPEELAIFIMVEVLTVLEAVHQTKIIHADIKPDNFLVLGPPKVNLSSNTAVEVFAECPSMVKIIDFGRSIDMKLLPPGTTFTEKVKTDGFTCCEMRDGREWTYQTDLYGVAAIAHCLLWGTYMNVTKDGRGNWNIKGTYKRYWNRNLWSNFFQTMLNAPSCQELPDLSKTKEAFMTAFMDFKTKDFKMVCSKFENICKQK